MKKEYFKYKNIDNILFEDALVFFTPYRVYAFTDKWCDANLFIYWILYWYW